MQHALGKRDINKKCLSEKRKGKIKFGRRRHIWEYIAIMNRIVRELGCDSVG